MRSWAGASGPQCARWGGFGSRCGKTIPKRSCISPMGSTALCWGRPWLGGHRPDAAGHGSVPNFVFRGRQGAGNPSPGSPDAGFGCRGRRPKAKASRRPSLIVAFRVVFFNRKLPQGTLLAHPKNPPKRGRFGQIVSIQLATEPLLPAGCPHPRGGRLMARISITSAI